MDLYDIGEAFAEIEAELISSMIRNMKHHRAEETKEGFEWTQWQVEQLKALEAYKKANQKKYKGKFKNINNLIEEAIKEARSMGNMEQEIEILEAIKKGFLAYSPRDAQIVGEFFNLNDRKLEALIKATKDDLKKAEHAMLRMAEDQYRQVIFNAQVYANTGAGTYEKAVDMATEEFISRGINCVEYSNGARHTIKDYADMALRTAAKRAYLTGEGEKRMEWGISTVIMNKRGNPCPKCLPFVGKVLIDDVWSGGSREDGDYPLMSRAIELGLYHPRCKDSHSTYFEGISTPPDDSFSKRDVEEIKEGYTTEQKRRAAMNNYQKFSRLADNALDKENKQKYTAKADYWLGEYSKYYNQSYKSGHQAYNDKKQFERYRNVIGDMAPDNLEDFVKIKYNDSAEYGKLKHAYRIVNQYENNSGKMAPSKIVELHDFAVDCKAKMTGKARREANIGAMELDGKLCVASSQINNIDDPAYINYKGDKKQIVLFTDTQRFHPFQVGKHHGEVDSEYKFFEYASVIAGDGEKHSLKILSERNMCESCRFVMDEFKAIYPNVDVEVVSHKEDKAAKNKNKNRIFEIDVKLRKKDANNR